MWVSLLSVLLAAQSPGQLDVRNWQVAAGSPLAIESKNWPLRIRGEDDQWLRIGDTEATVVADIGTGGGRLVLTESDRPSPVDISVPQQTDLTVTGALADIEISNIVGDVTATNEHNPVTIRRVKGKLRARSLLAAVHVTDVQGAVDAESHMAAVSLENIDGRIRARSAMAGISLVTSHADDVELHATRGIVSFVGGVQAGAEMLLTTHRGPINVELYADSDVTVEISADQSKVRVLGASVNWVGSDQGQFSLGDGSGRLSLQSISGPITVTVRSE